MILVRVRRDYGGIPMLVTENSAAYDDEPDDVGFVRDRWYSKVIAANGLLA